MKDPPYMEKKDGTMHRQDRGMTCSLISILQGQVE